MELGGGGVMASMIEAERERWPRESVIAAERWREVCVSGVLAEPSPGLSLKKE